MLVLLMSATVFAETQGEELISVDFFNADVRTAFQDLSYQAGITILVDDYIQGYVSLSLTDVPVERVIEVICLKGGYGYKKIEEDLYVIGAIEPSNPTFEKHAETHTVKLNYAKAETVVALLSHYQKYLRARDGMIVVRAWPNQIGPILEDIKALDKPVKQVLGQVIIAEVTAEAKRELGLGNVQDGLDVIDKLIGGHTTLSLADSVRLASMLKILQAEGKASLKASPTIVVPEGNSATISIGKEVRQVVHRSQQGTYSIERMEAATQLTLEVQRITDDDEIWMNYEVSAGDISGDFQENTPTILTRMAKGTVIVANNTVFTIGGLTKQVDSVIDSTFPPGKQDLQQDTELLIIIFPHIIGSELPEESQLDMRLDEFFADNETRLTAQKQEKTANQPIKLTVASYLSSKLDAFVQERGHEGTGANILLEGQLNLTPNLGVFGATIAENKGNTSSSVKLTYGGILLRTASVFKTPDFYIGFGAGAGYVTAGDATYNFEHKLAKVGMDIALGENIVIGLGYNYMPTKVVGENGIFDLSGGFVRIGISF